MLCPGKQLSKSEELGDLQAWTLAESSVSGRCPDMSKTLARVLLASAAGTAQSERDFADIKYHTARDRAFLGPYFKAFERRLRQWDKNVVQLLRLPKRFGRKASALKDHLGPLANLSLFPVFD